MLPEKFFPDPITINIVNKWKECSSSACLEC